MVTRAIGDGSVPGVSWWPASRTWRGRAEAANRDRRQWVRARGSTAVPIYRSAASLTCERASAAPQRIDRGFPGLGRHLDASVRRSFDPFAKGLAAGVRFDSALFGGMQVNSVQRSWGSASAGNLANELKLQRFAPPRSAGDFGRAGDGTPQGGMLWPRTAGRVCRRQWRWTGLRLATWLAPGRRGAVVHEALPGDQT